MRRTVSSTLLNTRSVPSLPALSVFLPREVVIRSFIFAQLTPEALHEVGLCLTPLASGRPTWSRKCESRSWSDDSPRARHPSAPPRYLCQRWRQAFSIHASLCIRTAVSTWLQVLPWPAKVPRSLPLVSRVQALATSSRTIEDEQLRYNFSEQHD